MMLLHMEIAEQTASKRQDLRQTSEGDPCRLQLASFFRMGPGNEARLQREGERETVRQSCKLGQMSNRKLALLVAMSLHSLTAQALH